MFSKLPVLTSPTNVSYASLSQVGYNITGWLNKNKDPLNDVVLQLMGRSTEPLIATVFKPDEDGE